MNLIRNVCLTSSNHWAQGESDESILKIQEHIQTSIIVWLFLCDEIQAITNYGSFGRIITYVPRRMNCLTSSVIIHNRMIQMHFFFLCLSAIHREITYFFFFSISNDTEKYSHHLIVHCQLFIGLYFSLNERFNIKYNKTQLSEDFSRSLKIDALKMKKMKLERKNKYQIEKKSSIYEPLCLMR